MIITQLLNETLDDLINDDGLVYKTMLSSFMENKSEKNKNILSYDIDKNIKIISKRDEIKNDPIVLLVEKIELCKNRREKKRLLAEFNKNIGFAQDDINVNFKKTNTNNNNDNQEEEGESHKNENEEGFNGNKNKNTNENENNTEYFNNNNGNNTKISRKFNKSIYNSN